MPLDPISGVMGGLQSLFGAGQAIFGAGKAKRTQKDLESYAEGFQPNKSILDYYNESKKRYNVDPTETSTYKLQQQGIGANTAQAIGATQDRRGGLASIGRIMKGATDASGRAIMNAEAVQGQNLSRLGQAAGMKMGEEQKKFDLMYNLKAQKAAAAANQVSSGIKNMFGGLGTVAGGFTKGLGKTKSTPPSNPYANAGDFLAGDVPE